MNDVCTTVILHCTAARNSCLHEIITNEPRAAAGRPARVRWAAAAQTAPRRGSKCAVCSNYLEVEECIYNNFSFSVQYTVVFHNNSRKLGIKSQFQAIC